jgi:quinol-cytochrome oxidoreductase complex cytochrome b subunit
LVRNLHYWSAQFLVIITLVHLLRVVFTGAYAPPRRFNYLLGMGLLVLSVLLDFTGYILRWDEGIRWALVTGTNLVKSIPLIGNEFYMILVGGSQPGPATLIRFYGWHVFGLALAAGILVAWHIFRVRRDGGIAVPPPPLREDQKRITRFELVRREVLAMLLAVTALLLLSTFAPAPLAEPISTSGPFSETVRAPWFFLWVQQMLKLGNPFFWGVFVPLAVLTIFSLSPYIFPNPAKSELGRWFPKSNRVAQLVTFFILLAMIVLTLLAYLPAP